MDLKRRLPKLATVSMLITIMGLLVVFGLPTPLSGPKPGAMVDEHWWHIIVSDDEAMTAAGTHDIDALGVPRPVDLDWFLSDPSNAPYGWTVTSTERIGYTFTMENNRVWPFGTQYGNPNDPYYDNAMHFRKGIHRLIDKDSIIGIYAPLMGKATAWLPPAQAPWINPDVMLPTFDPAAAAAEFDAGGFVQGTHNNPYYDPDWSPYSAQYLRIDPKTGEDVSFEYYAIGPEESPLGYEMATMITSWMQKMGLTVNLVAGTWLGMVIRLINMDLTDYQFMTGVGIVWGSVAPDILYDFTYSTHLPLWNFASMNISDADYWGRMMMSTLNETEVKEATFKLQEILNTYEPYFPMLLWEMYTAYTDPWPEAYPDPDSTYTNPGFIGIVTMQGFGGLASGNVWGKKLGRANRFDSTRPDVQINKWRLGAYLDTLNPLTADTVPDWQVLSNVLEGHYDLNPYSMDYMWIAAEGKPVIEKWIGTNSSEHYGGNGVYDAPVTYDAQGELLTYNGIPVDDVTEADLLGDDVLGMKTTWTLKDNLYWHDSDPGPDLKFGTADDGVVYPVNASDYKFGIDLLRNQQNIRYYSSWEFIADVKIKGTYTYTVYEERRYLFSFEGHGVGLLAPRHIWKPWIAGPDGILWTEDDNHHNDWYGWEEKYMLDPVRQRLGASDMWLTKLIGFGPFVYHYGGWKPGQYAHFETNPIYFYSMYGSEAITGDTNLDGSVFIDDLYIIIASFGLHPNVDPDYDERGDVVYPAQTIDLDDVYAAAEQIGRSWYP